MPEPKYNREDHLKSRDNKSSFLHDLSFHLEELRTVLLISILSLIISFIIAFYYSESLIKVLQMLAPVDSKFFQLKPGELFTVSLKVSLFTALYVSLPVVIQQLYLFVKPALKDDEKKIFSLIAFFSPVLFFLGLLFAYYALLPSLLEFLLNFKTGLVEKRYGLEAFINLVLSIETITGISFQLPVLIFVLGILNLVKVKILISTWRYVVLAAFVLAALLTPTPDPLTMSVLAIALLVLYFSTILVLKLFGR